MKIGRLRIGRKILSTLSLFIIILNFSTPQARASISDSIFFPTKDSTFDSQTLFGHEYQDYLTLASWDRIRSGTAPFVGKLTIYFVQNVNLKRYTFEAALVSPSGQIIPISGTQSVTESKYSLYCWGTYCKSIYLSYNVALPQNSEIGKYSLKFTANWLGSKCVGSVCESDVPISKSVIAAGALEILSSTMQSPSPVPSPIATPSAVATPSSESTPAATSTPQSVPVNLPLKFIDVSHDWAAWADSLQYVKGSKILKTNEITTLRIQGRCTKNGFYVTPYTNTDSKGVIYKNGSRPLPEKWPCVAYSFSGNAAVTAKTVLKIVEMPQSHQGSVLIFKPGIDFGAKRTIALVQ